MVPTFSHNDPASAFSGCIRLSPRVTSQVVSTLPCSFHGSLHKECAYYCPKLEAVVVSLQEIPDDEVKNEGHSHVFLFWNQITKEQQKQLEHDFDAVDDFLLHHDLLRHCQQEVFLRQRRPMYPPRMMDWNRKRLPPLRQGANISLWEDFDKGRQDYWRSNALHMYARGQIALLILHGGLDDFTDDRVPKSIVDFGLISRKCTLQLYLERVRRLQHLAGRRCGKDQVQIPVFIMCNQDNHDLISSFLMDNDYFGLCDHSVHLFLQRTVPLFDAKGRMALKEKHLIHHDIAGSGSVLQCIALDGIGAELKSHCVSYVYAVSIDNVLAKIGDPAFLGLSVARNASAAVKCFARHEVEGPIGIYCSIMEEAQHHVHAVPTDADPKQQLRGVIIEDYELHASDKDSKASTGSMVFRYNWVNSSQYVFKLDFLTHAGSHYSKHPPRWHAVPVNRDRINLVTGGRIAADENHTLFRLERFLMDCFELADRTLGVIMPSNEWGYLENLSGPNSPQDVLLAMSKLHQSWILAAGGEFSEGKVASEREDSKCEISPLISYDGEDLEGHFWMPIELPFYLSAVDESKDFSVLPLKYSMQFSEDFVNCNADCVRMDQRRQIQFGLQQTNDIGRRCRGHRGEHALDAERLPPTPEVTESEVESEEENVVEQTMVFDEDDGEKWLLSTRMRPTTSRALIGSVRIKQQGLAERNNLYPVDCDNALRFASAIEAATPHAAFTHQRKGKMFGMYGPDTARGQILNQPRSVPLTSLRVIPDGRHGLELSEFGTRQVHPTGDRDWWWGRPQKTRASESPMDVPVVAENFASCTMS